MGWHPFAKQAARERQLEAELRFHLEQRIADQLASGMSPAEARRRAMLEFGTVDRVKEECRDLHWETAVESLYRDLRYTLRCLAKDARFTVLAILALALGIGSATVIFSAFYGVILNTFAFTNADEITAFYIVDRDHPRNRRPNLRLPELAYFREHNHVFQDLSGEFGGFGGTPLMYSTGGSTYQFDGCFLSANSFELFGMQPLLGRLPTENDVKPGAAPVFVIGAKLWREHFNNDPNVVGRTFTLNGVPRMLVGVMPPRFRWAWVDAWLPFSLDPNEIANNPDLNGKAAYVVGRLKPGVTVKQAAADLDLVAHEYSRIEPKFYPKRFTVTAKRSSEEAVEGLGFANLLYPLMAAVILLLLIGCANVANLLLARATVRVREIAVRAALGASRARLLRQFLVESLCLAGVGCMAGCLLAYTGIKVLRPLIPYNAFPQEAVIELNRPVLLFSTAMAVLSTLICGMAPAIHAMRLDLRSRLSGSGTASKAGTAHGKLRSALVIAEVALSVILLVNAGVMLRTFLRLENTELGINPNNVLFAGLSFPHSIQKPEDKQHAFELFIEKLKHLPGITATSSTLARPPFGGPISDVIIPGKVHSDAWRALVDLCSEDYLAVMQMRLQQGRFLSEADVRGARHVAVINETFARQYFPDQSPNGQIVKFTAFDRVPSLKDASFEIVGVVADAKNQGFAEPATPQVFLPDTLIPTLYGPFVVRTAVKPESLIPQIQQLAWSIDPNIAMVDASSLESFLQKFFYANSEFEFITLSSFAMLGLLLVMIGIFSVMGYTVALQTHEIGVRMALGATRGRIIRTVLGKGTILVTMGLAIGVAGSLWSARFLAHQFRGVSPIDAATYASVLVLMAAAGLSACFVPARRAARVDPLEAIRCE
jgi:putative ABC transport system permease protein